MERIELKYNQYSISVYHRPGKTDEKIIFLHGGALDNALMSWKEVIELTDDRYDVYAIDLIGYGNSDKPDIEYTIPMYADFLHDILIQLGIEKTHLAGLSMGGGISIGFSLKYPSMVDKLILIGSLGLFEKMRFHSACRWFVNSKFNSKSYQWLARSRKRIKWSIRSALIGDKNKITGEMVDMIYNMLKNPDCNKAWEYFQRYELGPKKMTTDLTSKLAELKMPVLIVNGEKDPGVPVKAAASSCSLINDSQLYIMKGCRHWAQKERPDEFVKVMQQFLDDRR